MSQQLLTTCVLVTAMVGAGAAVVKMSAWLWRTLRALARMADDLTGEPDRPGAPGRKGVLDRLAAIEGHLERLDTFEARLSALERAIVPVLPVMPDEAPPPPRAV